MQDPASLDNLRDIAEPAPVPWWPPAPGWWVVIALVAAGLAVCVYKAWQRWKANAYRRAATAEVNDATNDSEIVEILKRTAMCADTRTHVGSLAGADWCEWLGESGGVPVPAELAQRISVGVYRDGSIRTPALAEFARRWISDHRIEAKGGCDSL